MGETCWSCGVNLSGLELACACGAALGPLEAGEVLDGHLRLEKVIGKGGMGRVFLATDLRIERAVAVKVINRADAGPDFLFRFEREARLLGTLDHPNLVTVHSFGWHRAAPYLVMKLLEGWCCAPTCATAAACRPKRRCRSCASWARCWATSTTAGCCTATSSPAT